MSPNVTHESTLLLERPERMAWIMAGLVVVASAAAAWLALIVAAGDGPIDAETLLRALCLAVEADHWGRDGPSPPPIAMWILMSVAMMLPTATAGDRALRQSLIGRELSGGAAGVRRTAVFVAGYLITWTAASIAFAATQAGLRVAGRDRSADDAATPFAIAARISSSPAAISSLR